MDLGLQGRVALIAGASSGLGLASAVELAREGCRIVICSRSSERIDAAAWHVRERAGAGTDVLPIAADVRDEAAVEDLVEQTVARFGSLNVLVTNAGGPPAGFVDDLDATAWRDALELNLMSTINLTRFSLPYLRQAAVETGHARIIMITSVSAKQPIPNLYLSNVARAGVQGFAKSLAEEVGADGITVNTILPGYTRTDRLKQLVEVTADGGAQSREEIMDGWAQATALRRLGEPEEFAAVLTFLASRRAAYVTGVALPVDGGRSKHLL